MRRLSTLLFLTMLLLVSDRGAWISIAQDADSARFPQIDADNIRDLQSVQTYDFADLPDNLLPASGLFAVSNDASHIVTFGNRPGEAPLSQAILWGYGDELAVNAIDDSSLARFLSSDGRCLYAGYRGYYTIWELDPGAEDAIAMHSSRANAGDSVVGLWLDDNDGEACSTQVYAEIAADDGSAYVLAPDLSILHPHLFATDDHDAAARVGRIPPPLALTFDLEGTLYRWDLKTHDVTATVPLGELAMFGSVNRSATHYVWLQTDYAGLHMVDFEDGTDRLVASFDPAYVSHIKLTHDADVILGVDPRDSPGTVSAWLAASGERLDLGAFRHCERTQPDLALLSRDGTALVIGCDTGVDVWRVVSD